MMKKLLLFLTLGLLLFTTGCDSFNIEVTTPENDTMINGQWQAVDCVNLDGVAIKDFDELNAIMSFSKKEAIIFDKIYRDISYKAKQVNNKEYLNSILGYVPEEFKTEQELIVITISSGNTYIKDIIVLKDRCLMLEGENIISFKKINEEPLTDSAQIYVNEEDEKYLKMKSGILLGMKNKEESKWAYRTLWIYNEDNEIKYEEIPFILLPRKDGFFRVENVVTKTGNNNISISYLNEASKEVLKEESNKEEAILKEDNFSEDITFIGNDYISIREIKNESFGKIQNLGTYLIDIRAEDNRIPVTLGSVLGKHNLSSSINREVDNLTNFAINRNRGRWCFYSLKDDNAELASMQEEYFNEYGNKKEISARVSKDIARHDELYTSWQGIANQIPSATDALSSPNDNMAIIRTKGKLYVYRVSGDRLDMSSEVIIPIEGKEEIIMAEWALGQYVDYWTEEVKLILDKD